MSSPEIAVFINNADTVSNWYIDFNVQETANGISGSTVHRNFPTENKVFQPTVAQKLENVIDMIQNLRKNRNPMLLRLFEISTCTI